MKLEIDRSKWLRGEGGVNSKLLRYSDGKMCCLGFLALECGFEDDEIRNRSNPSELNCSPGQAGFGWLVKEIYVGPRGWDTSRAGEEAIDINDNEKLTQDQRERMLADLFEDNGIELSFVDGETY